MRKNNLILICFASFLVYGGGTLWAQRGVLLPEKLKPVQLHGETCEDSCCSHHDHDSSLRWETGIQQLIMSGVPAVVTTRRGDITNPVPGIPATADTIGGARDVSVVFGAGESNLVSNERVIWPFNGHPVAPATVGTVGGSYGKGIYVGDFYSPNDVISINDNNGEVAGALRDVRLFNHSTSHTGTQYGYDANRDTVWYNYTPASTYVVTHYNTAGSPLETWKLVPAGPSGDAQRKYLQGRWGPPPATWYNPSGNTAYRTFITSVQYDPTHDYRTNIQALAGGAGPDPIPTTLNYMYPGSRDGSGMGACLYPYKSATYYNPLNPNENEYVVVIVNHIAGYSDTTSFKFYGETADTLYTSTKLTGGRDDGERMLYKIPGTYDPTGTISGRPYINAYDDTLNNRAKYIRPTTILVNGVNNFDTIVVRDVQWYAAYQNNEFVRTDTITPFPAFGVNSCTHFSGWVSYMRDVVSFGNFRHQPSNRYVDAAVRLLDNADVRVTGNVLDKTTGGNSGNTVKTIGTDGTFVGTTSTTDALLVLPGLGNTNNFRFNVDGDVIINHIQDKGNYAPIGNPLTDGWFYSAHVTTGNPTGGVGPGDPFPVSQSAFGTDTIYLTTGATLWHEVSGLAYDYKHPRKNDILTHQNPSLSADSLWMPYQSTYGSVYGVNGLFHPGQVFISTRSAEGVDTTSIIKIGANTNNQDSLQIFSSGMLKNYRAGTGAGAVASYILNIGNTTDLKAPGFHLSNDAMPLYIINDGDGNSNWNCGGIIFNYPGVDSINNAIANATGKSDLHIQSLGFVKFLQDDATPHQPKLNLDVLTLSPGGDGGKDNQIKILSDSSYIYIENDVNFIGDESNLTIWARGLEDQEVRGKADLAQCRSGFVWFTGDVNLDYSTGTAGSGLIFIRSEHDDVIIDGNLVFKNTVGQQESGELMIQAGQDVQINGTTMIEHEGPESMLYEAQKTLYFGNDLDIKIGLPGSSMQNGDLTFKAGYPYFNENAHIDNPLDWTPPGFCYIPGYANRLTSDNPQTGGDIWFRGHVDLTLQPLASDFVDTYMRAYNSIYVDGNFTQTMNSKYYLTTQVFDTTLVFAETGNYEAMPLKTGASGNAFVEYNYNHVEGYSYFLLQAGNKLGNPCGPTACFTNDEWHGNILFGQDKTFTLNQKGRGPTLISAARDIENQAGANVLFNFTNANLDNTDLMKVTAGRHIETHAPWLFNYAGLANITNDITMEAGHLAGGCNYFLCKTKETPSNIAFNLQGYTSTGNNNEFAQGGTGQGSILLFDSLRFDYIGHGNILMTAKNGNIESNPYLHGNYNGGAPIVFNYGGTDTTRMEAIDIKLHDVLSYNGTANANANGQFEMAAFDSILTRNISYVNKKDAGSVSITTDKMKAGVSCAEYTHAYPDGPGIHQGHIVLGYGADCANANTNDKILFDFSENENTTGANLSIKAGYAGFASNPVTGKINTALFAKHPADKGKGYGGNITFDFMEIYMAVGNGDRGGFAEISTPNGNIWGKDSLKFHGINGNLLIDAGLGSVEDTIHAVRWTGFSNAKGAGSEAMLNTRIPLCCEGDYQWRTGNIMLKGGSVDFLDDVTGTNAPGKGNVTIRTREGFIDVYDKFDATNMTGHLLKYAGSSDYSVAKSNQWGDISERDFQYTPVENSGSVFFGADDNIMLNYGYSNGTEKAYHFSATYPDLYDVTYGKKLVKERNNPFYPTIYDPNNFDPNNACFSTYNVTENGYLWYHKNGWQRNNHRLYRGCTDCSPLTGVCNTSDNGARPLTFNFYKTADNKDIKSGGLAVVASNYIDFFTKFTYQGGTGSGLHAVPGMNSLKGEGVTGFGLYIKSLFNGPDPEDRRRTCFDCGEDFPFDNWSYITFHDDARIYTQSQKSWIEAPVIEFFGHAELDAYTLNPTSKKLTVKSDSLVFHDSVIFAGTSVELLTRTTESAKRENQYVAKRLGVFNDDDGIYYQLYGKAIQMPDRNTPIFELGYQRCYEPLNAVTLAPNMLSERGGELTPRVGGDIIVAFKYEFALPIYNTVVANHARISFNTRETGSEYEEAFIRADLLRIRNKVEFYTDPTQPTKRVGTFKMTSNEQMPSIAASGMYPHHVHLEPGSELSIPGEDSLIIISTTTLGGYGEVHEKVYVRANGIIAPGYASLMEWDCQTGRGQGRLTTHDLYMEKDAVMRISISNNNCRFNPETGANDLYCTQTDTLFVKDSIFFFGKIPLYVLPETPYIEPGCYLFLVYNDLETSAEYVNNLELKTTKYGGLHFRLDKSERGRVYLCVAEMDIPVIQRYINIHAIEGVTTNPVSNIYHYVKGHDDFVFTASYAGKSLIEVSAVGYYSGKRVVLTPKYLSNSTYEYTIRQVVEPWDVYFDPTTLIGNVNNESVLTQRVWSYRNTLFINVDQADVVSIYNVTGVLYQKLEIPAGLKKLTLEKGIYLVTLKNGSVYKIVIN